MKKAYCLYFFSLATLSCEAILTPGEGLKAPGEVIEEIKQFIDSLPKDQFLEQVNDPKRYAEEMRRAERLFAEALFAYFMCDKSLNDDLKIQNSEIIKELKKIYGGNQKLVNEKILALKISDELPLELELPRFVSSYQAWARDPVRSALFEGSRPERHDQEYRYFLAKERSKIFVDCQKCEEYKRELAKHIKDLDSFVLYRKPRII